MTLKAEFEQPRWEVTGYKKAGAWIAGDMVAHNKIQQQINSEGGTVITGPVTAGRDVIGGNQYIYYQGVPPETEKEQQWYEPEMVRIAAGRFLMGSEAGEGNPASETPRDWVEIRDFFISRNPVTNGQYYAYLQEVNQTAPPELGWEYGTSPSPEQREQAVKGVTWHEALAYCRWLAKPEQTGRSYTLPSEAQWEYVAGIEGDPLSMLSGLREWTTTLWGSKSKAPEDRYRYPWREDGRDNLQANDQIRRVTRGSTERPTQRGSEKPGSRGWVGPIGFRIVRQVPTQEG